MVLKMITVKISPNQIFTIFVLEMDDKFNKFILEGWKCRCWMAIDNTNNKTFARWRWSFKKEAFTAYILDIEVISELVS